MWVVFPVSGSSRPSAPVSCAVYQTVPSAAGATSCGCEPAGTGNSRTVGRRVADVVRSPAQSAGITRPTRRKRLLPSGRKTIVSPSSKLCPVASCTTTPCVTSTVSLPWAGFVPISRRAAWICARQRASCADAIVLRSAGLTVARPNASRAVWSVRQ